MSFTDVFFPPIIFLAADEEDTIAAQEKVEGNVDHTEELDDLAREGRCFYCFIFTQKMKHVIAPVV